MFELIASVISFFYDLTSSYAAAIVLLTVTIRLLLFPLTAKQTRSMQNMARVQPQVKALQEEHSGDRQKMNEEVMKFYKENKINPAAGCLPLLLQMPILFGLYRVVSGLSRTVELSGLMTRVSHPQYLGDDSKLYRSLVSAGGQMRSLGIDLAHSAQTPGTYAQRLPYVILVILVGVTGYLQQVIMTKQQGPPATAQAAQMQKVMKYMPVMFAVISFNIQAAIVLYWIVGNIWMIIQSQVLRKMAPPIIPPQGLEVSPGSTSSESGKPVAALTKASSAKAAAGSSAKNLPASNGSSAKPFRALAEEARANAQKAAKEKAAARANNASGVSTKTGSSSGGSANGSASTSTSKAAKSAPKGASNAAKQGTGPSGQKTKRK